MLIDNPADRLMKILEAGMAVPAQTNCRQAWNQILGADPNNPDELFRKLGKTLMLPAQTLDFLHKHMPQRVGQSHHWWDPIETAFGHQQLADKWDSFRRHINENCIAHLALIVDFHNAKFPLASPVLDKELEEILAAVIDLLAVIDKSQLSDEAKAYLRTELDSLTSAIRDFNIAGGLPIRRHAEAIVGHATLNENTRSIFTDPEVGERLKDIVSAAASIASGTVNVLALATIWAPTLAITFQP